MVNGISMNRKRGIARSEVMLRVSGGGRRGKGEIRGNEKGTGSHGLGKTGCVRGRN